MIKKALFALIAVSAISAAAAIAMVAAAFALFALLSDSVGAAGAAAIVAAVAAAIVALGGLIAALGLRPPRARPGAADDAGLSAKLLGLARQKPLLAAGAALAVGVIAFRNPKLVTALVTGILAGKASPKN